MFKCKTMKFSTFRILVEAWWMVTIHKIFRAPEYTYGWWKARLALIKKGEIQ